MASNTKSIDKNIKDLNVATPKSNIRDFIDDSQNTSQENMSDNLIRIEQDSDDSNDDMSGFATKKDEQQEDPNIDLRMNRSQQNEDESQNQTSNNSIGEVNNITFN